MFEKIKKKLESVFGKKQTTMQSFVVPKSDENELCEDKNNQGETVQLPSGE